MLDRSDRHSEQVSSLPQRIGSYLVDAGLITSDQVHVALQDQQSTGMRFGEVVVARGWLKEQTVEWIMAKVVVPEQRSQQPAPKPRQAPVPPTPQPQASRSRSISSADLQDPDLINGLTQVRSIARNNPTSTSSASATHSTQVPLSGSTQPGIDKPLDRRPPISKPLPSVNSADEDVSWVG
jgi:hypothetical protein